MGASFWREKGLAFERALVEQLREFETALVAEAMAALGCAEPQRYYSGDDIKLLTKLTEPMVGAALTLTADTSTPGNQADTNDLWASYDLMEAARVPVVVIIQAVGGRRRHECILGDGMAKTLKASGSCGLVTDGGARDIERIDQVGYAVFGSGFVPNHVQLIYKLSEEPVEVSGVRFRTCDLVHGDADGVLIIPPEYHKLIVEACILCRDTETRVHTFLRRTDKRPAEKRDFTKLVFERRDEALAELTGGATDGVGPAKAPASGHDVVGD